MFLHLSVSHSVHEGGGVSQHARGRVLLDPPGQTPPRHTPLPTPKLATAADGTHPTGMHSCFKNF